MRSFRNNNSYIKLNQNDINKFNTKNCEKKENVACSILYF